MSGDRHLCGFHAVREALRVGAPLRWVAIDRERRDARTRELEALARSAGVAVRREPAAALDRLSAGERHQGVVAQAEAKAVLAVEDLLAPRGRPGLLVALDGIEDPHNLGAIVRSAAAAGADGMILPSRRAAGVSETVERVSAGALEHLPIARAVNLTQALEKAKAAGYWLAGLDAEAPLAIWDHDFRLATVLVVGAEGRGLHDLTRRRCDFLVSIPLADRVASLNAAAAAAVALFEVARQRRTAPATGRKESGSN